MGLFSFLKKEEERLLDKLDQFKDTLDLEAKEAMEVIEKQQAIVAQLKYRPWRHAVFLLLLFIALTVSFLLVLLKYEQQLYVFGRTWVAYNHPPLNVLVISDYQNCLSADCKQSEEFVVDLMKEKIVPTIKVNYLDKQTLQAKNLIETYNVHALPVFIFDENITKIANWEEQKALFKEQGDKYIFNLKAALVEPKTFLSIKNPNENNLIWGDSENNAPVIVQAFVDLISKQSTDTIAKIESLQKRYPQKIKVYIYDTPLQKQFTNSYNLGLAWECLKEQQLQLDFWEKIKEEFANNKDLENLDELYKLNKLKETAVAIENIDEEQFNTCFNQEKFTFALDDNLSRAEELGLVGVPTVIINSQIVNEELDINDLEGLIKKYLE